MIMSDILMRTLVVMPTYNELESLAKTVSGIFSLGKDDIDILIVDDASPDGTGDLADRLSRDNPGRVSVLHRTGKLGLGSAYLEGFRLGLDRGYGAVCEMDADSSHDPASLPSLIDPVASGSADVTLGSRHVRGGRIIGWGPHRHLMSNGAILLSRLALGLKTRDVTTGFRCYSAKAAGALLDLGIRSNGYAFQEETVFYCEKLGFVVREIPIVFRDRVKGKSKLSRREVVQFFATIRRLLAVRVDVGADDRGDCPACGSRRRRRFEVLTQESASGRRAAASVCSDCGLAYLDDWRVDRSAVYGTGYAAWGAAGESDEEEVAASKRMAFSAQLAAALRSAEPVGRRLIDVGTGMGYLMDEAKRLGFEPSGLDISAYAVDRASERHPDRVVVGTLESAGLPDAGFDVVTMTDLLEHVPDPSSLVREANRVLVLGGLLVIVTPDFGSLSRRLLGRRWFQFKWEHVAYWNRRGLAAFLARHGFEVIAVEPNRKRFRLSYYEYYFRRYALLGPLGRVISAAMAVVPRSWLKLSFSNPVTGEMLVVARKVR
jgi:2-polyprenyl-3-methyl-5-hydroxy-6-metoxy-1,4-benzoquinol methylase